jgi:hypothetical protein
MNLVEHAALGSHYMYLENGPEILISEQSEEDHGHELQNMHASGCNSLDQVRFSREHVQELRRRERSPS